MTMARIQPLWKANKYNIGYYNVREIWPRNIHDRKKALFLYIDHFCLIWKSQGVSFNQAIQEIQAFFN